jgi:hypothetical protein
MFAPISFAPISFAPISPKTSRKTSLKISCVCSATLLLAALAVSLGGHPAAAAGPYRNKPVVSHHGHRLYDVYRGYSYAPAPALPHGPEYGFLNHVPPNAVRMPGYTFVPGVGILGESCDLPTSACSNEYRDTQ